MNRLKGMIVRFILFPFIVIGGVAGLVAAGVIIGFLAAGESAITILENDS